MAGGVKLSRGRRRTRARAATKPAARPKSADGPEQKVYAPPKIPTHKQDVPESLYVVKRKRDPSPESFLTDDSERRDAMEVSRARRETNRAVAAAASPSASKSYSYNGRTPRSSYNEISPRSSYNEMSHRTFAGSSRASHRHASNEGSSYHGDINRPSPSHRKKLNKWYQTRFPIFSKSEESGGSESLTQLDSMATDLDTMATDLDTIIDTIEPGTIPPATEKAIADMDQDYLQTKQSVAYCAILITSIQLLILMMQLFVCSMAPFDVNSFIGPYPDAFSDWGGKNAYLMLYENQWWRLVTSSLLHIGVLHLLANAFCQLDAVALFEREWGSFRWLVVYLISSVGGTICSSLFDPDTIAVGSSAALMGMYGAKLAQVASLTCFEVKNFKVDEIVQLDQLSSVLCGLTLVSLLSCFSYIDWSAHMGGLLCGFLSGIVLFSNSIRSCCSWFFWVTFALFGLIAALTVAFYLFITEGDPDEDIGDACEYFRSMFPENYECNCFL